MASIGLQRLERLDELGEAGLVPEVELELPRGHSGREAREALGCGPRPPLPFQIDWYSC